MHSVSGPVLPGEKFNSLLELIHCDEYDVIVAYQADYDDNLHQARPVSHICIQAFVQHIQDFKKIAEAANLHWKDKGHVIAFAPDHGAHINPSTGKGDHGLDIPEDMDIFHCYGIFLQGSKNGADKLRSYGIAHHR